MTTKITQVTPDSVTLSGQSMKLWEFWLRDDALQLFDAALEEVPMIANLELLEDSVRQSAFLPRKRYADWPIDIEQLAEGVWRIDPESEVAWPQLVSADQARVRMSWEDFFTRVPEDVRKKILDNTDAVFRTKFLQGKPLRTTLSKPQEDAIFLALKYVVTPKKHHGGVVDRLMECQWVKSQDIQAFDERARLLEK